MNILQEIRDQGITPHFLVVHREMKCIVRVRCARNVYFMYKVILPPLTFVMTQPLEHVETASSVYRDHGIPFVSGESVLTKEFINGSTVYHTTLDCLNATSHFTMYPAVDEIAEDIIQDRVKAWCGGVIGEFNPYNIKVERMQMSSEEILNILQNNFSAATSVSGIEEMWSHEEGQLSS